MLIDIVVFDGLDELTAAWAGEGDPSRPLKTLVDPHEPPAGAFQSTVAITPIDEL